MTLATALGLLMAVGSHAETGLPGSNDALYRLLLENGTTFGSPLLGKGHVTDPDRARKIVHLALRDAALSAEIAAYLSSIEKQGGLEGSALWDEYFRAYDRTVAFSDGYRALIADADQVLPPSGRLRDYGCGTGNFSAELLRLKPERTVFAVDQSEFGVSSTIKKLEAVRQGRIKRDVVLLSNLKTYAAEEGSADSAGGVLNNVLYCLVSVEEKRRVLDRIRSDLKRGSFLFLTDPAPGVQHSVDSLELFLSKIVASAATNRAPMTESDIAVMAAINQRTLVGKSIPFMKPADLVALAKTAGLEFIREADSYYGATHTYIFRKP